MGESVRRDGHLFRSLPRQRNAGQLPCAAVLHQARHQRGVHGVPGALGHHVALDAMPGQGQVANQVKHLVPHILIGKAQRAVFRPLGTEDDGVLRACAANQTHVT